MGKVLVGLQAPPDEEEDFKQFPVDFKFRYSDETLNPIYKQFLK
jgi:hypothetical protein